MIPQELINRLGFDAWASCRITDALENTKPLMFGDGNIRYEYSDSLTVAIEWNEHGYTAGLRAYTKDGWKERTFSSRR
jgi:hypothetical protein